MAKFSRRAPATASASEWVNLPHSETAGNVNTADIGTGTDTGIGTGADAGISPDTGANAGTGSIPESRFNRTEPSTSASSRDDANPSEAPWAKFDRRAACKKFFNLRLTEFHWAVLVHLHEEEDGERSIQKIIHDILLPEIERRVGIEPRKKRLSA